mgnify:FL=1
MLHVGDDPELDVIGAHRAGLRSVWLHRGNATWTEASAQSEVRPDLTVRDLGELVDALGDAPEADARASPR